MLKSRTLAAVTAVPGVVFVAVALVVLASLGCKIATQFSFNVNEGWNAYWAKAAWSGGELYPPLSSLKLDNYLPPWFYLTGALGALVGDNIRAGRVIAAIALLLDGVLVALIAREVVGHRRGWWLAGAAFVALFGLFHQDYAGANDPQMLASLFMLVGLWLALQRIERPLPVTTWAAIVALMLMAGLIKHNIVAAPLSLALFLLMRGRWRDLVTLVGLSLLGVAFVCAGLYVVFGKNLFTLLLVPRPWVGAIAWQQSLDQLRQYSLLLAVIPFLALRRDGRSRLVLIYALVSLVLGMALSGGDGVDVNVFFDLLFCIAIGLGVMASAVTDYAGEPKAPGAGRIAAVGGWLMVALVPPLMVLPSVREGLTDALTAAGDDSYAADLHYIRSMPAGPVVCRDSTLCYWAGAPFSLDLNNIRTIVSARPGLEDEVVARIAACAYPLIELNDDWTDPLNGPLTDRIRAAIASHYAQDRESQYGLYWRPRC
jgi:hypothetical protein